MGESYYVLSVATSSPKTGVNVTPLAEAEGQGPSWKSQVLFLGDWEAPPRLTELTQWPQTIQNTGLASGSFCSSCATYCMSFAVPDRVMDKSSEPVTMPGWADQ